MKKSLALMAFLSTCAPAHAQQFGTLNILFCERTENVKKMLSVQFGEAVIFQGLASNGVHLDEVWYDENDGSYSFTRTNVKGNVTCILMAGKDGDFMGKQIPKPNL